MCHFIHSKFQEFSLVINSKVSSDSFLFKLINNTSEIIEEASKDVLFSVYKNIYKIDNSLLSIKKDTSDKFSNVKKDFNSGLSSFFNGNEVNLEKNIKDGFNSSIITIKNFLLKKDSLANVKSKSYQDKLNISGVMKATVTTFIDYGNWLSNQSGIIKILKKEHRENNK